MRSDEYSDPEVFEALWNALSEADQKALTHWPRQLGLAGDPTTSWTAVPGLLSLAMTAAAQNLAGKPQVDRAPWSLDEAAATLRAPASAGTRAKTRSQGPSKNLARWRKNVRDK